MVVVVLVVLVVAVVGRAFVRGAVVIVVGVQ